MGDSSVGKGEMLKQIAAAEFDFDVRAKAIAALV